MLLHLLACSLISDAEISEKVGVGSDAHSAGDLDRDGYTIKEGDCDDDNPSAHPGRTEVWYDDVDEDCSGGSDFDQDGDGYDRDEECDDLDASRFPNLAVDDPWYDRLDQNCDGNDGDQDGDGYCNAGYVGIACRVGDGDCEDDPAVIEGAVNGFDDVVAGAINPGAAETWYDGVDANCGGENDFDQDADGFETADYLGSTGTVGADCNDTSAFVNPGASDVWYDGLDADCSEGSDYDQDGDGVEWEEDCEDTLASVHPGASEDCATVEDDDCDGEVNDEDAVGCVLFYRDADGDGYGDPEVGRCTCVAGGGEVSGDLDCDDADPAVNPGAVEACENGVDDDCDGGGCELASMSLAGADAIYAGEIDGDAAGATVGSAGDVNGDGLDDILVRSSGYAEETYHNAGAAYLILGTGL